MGSLARPRGTAGFATPGSCPSAPRPACTAILHAAAGAPATAMRSASAIQRCLRAHRVSGSSTAALLTSTARCGAAPRRSELRRAAAASMNHRQQTVQDSTLWAGDAVVLLLTQLSSDRLPIQNQGIVSALLLTTWTTVAWAKRDYTLESADYDAWSVFAPVISAVRSAALTWVIFTPLAAGAYGGLMASNLLWVPPHLVAPPAAAMSVFSASAPWLLAPDAVDGMAGPELEVLVALLFCLAAWRGLYSAYRAWSNFF